jgi:hypothetical protein
MIWNGDMVAACFLDTVPLFDSLLDPGPLSAIRTAQIEADLTASSRRPMGFAFLKLNSFFDLRMRAVVEEIVCVGRTVQHFWQFSHARTSDREWAAESGHALIHRMLSLQTLPELLNERYIETGILSHSFGHVVVVHVFCGHRGLHNCWSNVQKLRRLLPGNAACGG